MFTDIVRFAVFIAFFAGYMWAALKGLNLEQTWYYQRRRIRSFVVGLATSTLDWVLVVVTLWLLAGYWRTDLFLTAVAFSWATAVLGRMLQALSGGRPNVMMASLTLRPAIQVAIFLLSVAVIIALLVACAWIVFTRESGDSATALLVVTLSYLLAGSMVTQWGSATLLASPFLDEETRQNVLNGSLARMVTLVFVLAVLIPAIRSGVSDGDLVPDAGTSLAVVTILFGVVVFGSLLPYLAGVAKSRSLLTSYRDELSDLIRSAAQALELPTPGWGERLEATAESVESSYRRLAESHPMMSLDDEPVTAAAAPLPASAPTDQVPEEHGILAPLPEARPGSYDDYVTANPTSELAARLASANPANRGLEATYEQLIQQSKDSDPRFAYLRHLREFWDTLTSAYRDIESQPDVAAQSDAAGRWATYLRRRVDDLPPPPLVGRPAVLSVILGLSSIAVTTILSQLGERLWTVFTGAG
jgi:hypothetical protein